MKKSFTPNTGDVGPEGDYQGGEEDKCRKSGLIPETSENTLGGSGDLKVAIKREVFEEDKSRDCQSLNKDNIYYRMVQTESIIINICT